jgi:hypothetical protein
VHGDTVWAYASKKGLLKFFELGYTDFSLLPTAAEEYRKEEKKSKAKKGPRVQSSSFNTYPTYTEYEQIMQNFQSQFPGLCQLVNLGVLPSGRKILALKISDSVNLRQNEPVSLHFYHAWRRNCWLSAHAQADRYPAQGLWLRFQTYPAGK